MCGIAGVYCCGPAPEWRGFVEKIIDSQHHRGPDHRAIETVTGSPETVVLGHCRLGIIDLSAEANQPMWDVERRCVLVHNGEIYNYLELKAELLELGHRFTTSSDTEVILEAFKEWGLHAVDRFNGMFAFGFFDARKKKLWLFRDRFGQKPLYYYLSDGTLVFASTYKVMAEDLSLQPNLKYAARGLSYWVYEDGSGDSPYLGLKSVPPAHYLEVRSSPDGRLDVRLHKYYDFEGAVLALKDKIAGKPLRGLLAMTADCLEDAVDIRTRADVPVGISLSGGLDSSTVTALLSKRHSDLTGFVFGSPGDPGSEGRLAASVGMHTGIKVYHVESSVTAMIEVFRAVLEAQNAPFGGLAGIAQFLVYRAARAQGVKVLLGGQGADEAFLGYRKFQLFRLRELVHERRYDTAIVFALGMLPMLVSQLRDASLYWRSRRRYSRPAGMDTALMLPDTEPMNLGHDYSRPLWVRQLSDVMRFSLPTLLRYEDRNSMGNSVESRLPFMDHRLMEIGLALPAEIKVWHGFGKWILREIAKGIVPEEIRAARYKCAFKMNRASLIEQGLGAFIRKTLHERRSGLQEWMKPGAKIDEVFSDRMLRMRTNTFGEVTTLLWLGSRR